MKRKFLLPSIAVFMCLTVIMSCTKSEDLNDLSRELSDIAPYSWEVVSITTPGQVFGESAEESYVLELATDGSYNLSLDVNNCASQYAVPSDGQINFQGPACTYACCDSEFAIEMAGLFSEVTGFYVENSYLMLVASDGITSIRLKRL